MSRSAQGASPPPAALAPASSGGRAPRSTASRSDHHAALWLVGLAMVGRVLRSRRLYERVLVGAIVAAALARMGKEDERRTLARLEAWDAREIQRMEREAKRHGRGRRARGASGRRSR